MVILGLPFYPRNAPSVFFWFSIIMATSGLVIEGPTYGFSVLCGMFIPLVLLCHVLFARIGRW